MMGWWVIFVFLFLLLLLFPSSSSFNDTIAYVHDDGATILSTYILIIVVFMQWPIGRPVVRVVSSKFLTRQHYGSFHSHWRPWIAFDAIPSGVRGRGTALNPRRPRRAELSLNLVDAPGPCLSAL